MQTGEGKTLAAVMPAALRRARPGGACTSSRSTTTWRGATPSGWGRSTRAWASRWASCRAGMRRRRAPARLRRRRHLRHGQGGRLRPPARPARARRRAQLVHRPFHFALVDEADSLLIDEARVPLVIAGPRRARRLLAPSAWPSSWRRSRRACTSTRDEYGRDVELTDAGHRARGGGARLRQPARRRRTSRCSPSCNCALHARALLRRDVDYIVRDGRIEHRGRVHRPRGAGPPLARRPAGRARGQGGPARRRPTGASSGSITLQHFLRGYPRLCGMTGTARDGRRRAARDLRPARRA